MFKSDEYVKTIGAFAVLVGVVCLLPSILVVVWYWRRAKKINIPAYLLQILFCVAAVWLSTFTNKRWEFLAHVTFVWGTGLFIALLLVPIIRLFRKRSKVLRVQDFWNPLSSWRGLDKAFADPSQALIGKDYKTDNYVHLENYKRTAHVLVIGATGTGKTTLMKNLICHAIRHNQPCVVIDPKGDDSALEQIRTYWKKSGSQSPFKVFSMSHPKRSASYNPLKYGNANQLKDRMMEAFNWSEQYYQSVAGSFLTALTSATSHLRIELSLDRVSRLMSFKDEQAKLLRALKDRHDQGDFHALHLYERVATFFSKSKDSELMGLAAQIAILNNPTFGPLLSFEKAEDELDLRELRRSRGIAYFQLDTLGNADSARRLGRMIIEDLKALSSEVYKTEPEERYRPFYPIFVDEFGSFAAAEFVEMLKQSRGAKFALHLFCQGLEDLDVVSKEFRRQIMSNALTKIALRVDDKDTVNEFVSAVGTIDALEQSYQVEGLWLTRRTGAGNQRLTKQMVIEHDVLKNLKTGQAVMVDKSSSWCYGLKIPGELI